MIATYVCIVVVIFFCILSILCIFKKDTDETRIIQNICSEILRGPVLNQEFSESCDVLRRWSILPSATSSSTDLETATMFILVSDSYGKPYDKSTLALVILHELAHASSHDPTHSASWQKHHDDLVLAAMQDGVVPWWAEVDTSYPANILADI